MAEALVNVTEMVSKLQEKLYYIENKVTHCVYVGEYTAIETARKVVPPEIVPAILVNDNNI